MKKQRHFFLSIYGWTYWLPLLILGTILLLTFADIAAHNPSLAPLTWTLFTLTAILTFAGLAFFRDFPRTIPQDPKIMVAPADGKVTEITLIEDYPPLNGPAVRLGIFLSVLDVHVNRAPCNATVLSTQFTPGQFLDARHPESGLKNQSFTTTLTTQDLTQSQYGPPVPSLVVRQVVGAIARRIISPVHPGDVWTRGQRFGMIAFGSRTELYVPARNWKVAVSVGSHVKGGSDIVFHARTSQ